MSEDINDLVDRITPENLHTRPDTSDRSDSDVSGTTHKDHAEYVRAELVKNGEDKEWEVVVAENNTLLLDYDSKQVPEQFSLLKLLPLVKEFEHYESRSGNRHVVVYLSEPLGELSRIAWQAILGSDPKREALHMASLHKGNLNPIVLVMRKDRAK